MENTFDRTKLSGPCHNPTENEWLREQSHGMGGPQSKSKCCNPRKGSCEKGSCEQSVPYYFAGTLTSFMSLFMVSVLIAFFW